MFSIKVITAIKIIQELVPFLNKREGDSCRKCVISSKELSETCAVPSLTLNSVLAVMMKNKWVDKINRGYFLLLDPDTLTLYCIYSAFHGGIPIGEVADTRQSSTSLNSFKYENLEYIETEIMQKLTSRFKGIGFADMRTIIQ